MRVKVGDLRRIVSEMLNEMDKFDVQKHIILKELGQIRNTVDGVVSYFDDYKKFAGGLKKQLSSALKTHRRNVQGWTTIVKATAPDHTPHLGQIQRALTELETAMAVPFGGMLRGTRDKVQRHATMVKKLSAELEKELT